MYIYVNLWWGGRSYPLLVYGFAFILEGGFLASLIQGWFDTLFHQAGLDTLHVLVPFDLTFVFY